MRRNGMFLRALILAVTVIAALMTKDSLMLILAVVAFAAVWIIPPGQIILNWAHPEATTFGDFATRAPFKPSKGILAAKRTAEFLRWFASIGQIAALLYTVAHIVAKVLGIAN